MRHGPHPNHHMRSNSGKDARIELLRFVAAVFIMIGHMGAFGCGFKRPFRENWFYVEFFLMLTGYFTARHFAQAQEGNPVAAALSYTFRKFRRFLPYTTGAVLVTYGVLFWPNLKEYGWVSFLRCLQPMPAEMLYLSVAGKDGAMLFVMWFISAMFLVFPAFCLFLQIKNRALVLWLSALGAAVYYQIKPDFGDHGFPNQFFRVLCGMLAGVVIWFAAEWLKKQKLSRTVRTVLTAAEVLLVLLPIAFSFKNIIYLRWFLWCFLLSLILIFSGQTRIPPLSLRVTDALGRLSMPLFIWHLAVAHVINWRFHECGRPLKCLIFFGGTLAVSVLNLALADAAGRALARKKAVRQGGPDSSASGA